MNDHRFVQRSSATVSRRRLPLRVRYLIALRSQRRGRSEKAIEPLEEALASGITSKRLYRSLAAAYAKSGRWRRARKICRRGLRAHPNDPVLHLQLGHALRARRSTAAAAVHYATALALNHRLACDEATSTIERVERSDSPFEPLVLGVDSESGPSRLLPDKGPLEAFEARLDGLTDHHRVLTEAYRATLRAAAAKIRLRYLARQSEDDLEKFRAIAGAARVGDMSELMLRFATARSVDIPTSFVASVGLRSRQHQQLGAHGRDLPEWILNSKPSANEFSDILGLRRPWRTSVPVQLHAINPRPHTVLKPVGGGGARGVFVLAEDGTVLEIGTGKVLPTWMAAVERADSLLAAGVIPTDSWVLEEIVRGEAPDSLARDMKFYAFYGRIALALEIDRFPKPRHCWWTRDLDVVDVQKYRESFFAGAGPSVTDVELAERISLQIPAPFIRIDFLAGRDGMYFGEFTARPGGLHLFSDQVDRWLGEEFLEAQNRLEADLAEGATFELFSHVQPPVYPSVYTATR